VLNFVWGFLGCAVMLPIALLNGVHFPTHWGPLWLYGIASAFSGLLYILTLYRMDLSIMSPLYSFRTVFSVCMGVAFFNESLSVGQYSLIGIIFLAGLLVSLDEKFSLKSFFHKTTVLALVAIFCSAMVGVATKNAMIYEGFWEVTLWGSFLSIVPALFLFPWFYKDLKRIPIKKYSGVISSVLLSTLGLLAANMAFAANISITSAILSVPTTMIMAFLFSIFAPKLLEKHSMKIYVIRFSAAAVMVVAALRLTA
jgi:drug/metabolite transporter (DMT)-like permease